MLTHQAPTSTANPWICLHREQLIDHEQRKHSAIRRRHRRGYYRGGRIHHVGQICLFASPEGGAVSVLPDRRAQRSHEVSVIPLFWYLGTSRERMASYIAHVNRNQRTGSSMTKQSGMKWNSADAEHRSFLSRAYPTMKKNNPNIPIMLREAAGTQPQIFARYGWPLPLVYRSTVSFWSAAY